MYRREPPSHATWMLEHLASGVRDEALTGDLLEEFRSGRSDSWYWQQVLLACLVSWSRSLTARAPALLFALSWSVLAPAWKATIDYFAPNVFFDKAVQALGLFALPLVLAVWIAFHTGFLWAGILVYQFAHIALGRNLRRGDLRRAFWVAALVLPPVYFLTFIFGNLYQYSIPGLAHARLAANSIAQITDFGIFSDFIRVPYLVALLAALWGTVHPFMRRQASLPAESFSEGSLFSGAVAAAATPDPSPIRRFFAFMVAASLVNSTIAAILFCRLPASDTPTLATLLIRALGCMVVGVAGGAMGAYAYWQGPWSPFRDQSPVPFSLFALAGSSGWLWIPALVLFSGALSPFAAFVATIGAYALAASMRSATYSVLAPASRPSSTNPRGKIGLFEESLYRPPADLTGYTIAISLVVAGAALAVKWNFTAGAFLALAASLFAWKKTIPRDFASQAPRAHRRAAARVALLVLPAIAVTVWALLLGVSYRVAQAGRGLAQPGANHALNRPTRPANTRTIVYGAGGYISVVLWPSTPKKQIIPPVPISHRVFAPGSTQPLTIRFDGDYTYVQPPDRVPGPGAHHAQGTPLDVAIESNNGLPVVMAAHQNLPAAIPVARCRQIDLQIQNRDNVQGPVSLALFLTGARSAEPRDLYLDQQPILSTLPQFFSFKTSPVTETLHFSVPQSPSFAQFTGITVMFLPDIEHHFVAPKIAITQFQIFPR